MKDIWWKNKMFLITCYPLNTTLKRYIVELDLVKVMKNKNGF
jgi:sortase (surface protein transpeptidase)